MGSIAGERSAITGPMLTTSDMGWATCQAVEPDPQSVTGVYVFCGTRIPVAALLEKLKGADLLADFVKPLPV